MKKVIVFSLIALLLAVCLPSKGSPGNTPLKPGICFVQGQDGTQVFQGVMASPAEMVSAYRESPGNSIINDVTSEISGTQKPVLLNCLMPSYMISDYDVSGRACFCNDIFNTASRHLFRGRSIKKYGSTYGPNSAWYHQIRAGHLYNFKR